jgi:ribosomal protein S18 acetylase RimI-like enzyme
MNVRAAEEEEVDQLAKVWYDGWQDAHARILPAELAKHRTFESFRQRLQAALPSVRVAGSPGQPIGFCMVKGDQIYQLYVSAAARGTGVAAMLIADGEERIAATGLETAWLACAIGNERAAKFYEKNGWRRVGTVIDRMETPDGPINLSVWRYEKGLQTLLDARATNR